MYRFYGGNQLKNKYYISITDIKGMRCFSINKIIKNYIIIFLLLTFGGFAVLTASTVFFNVKMREYNRLIKEKAAEYNRLADENALLYNDLEDSKKQFENINEKIVKIEELISDTNHPVEETLTSAEKLEILQMDLKEKKFFLQVIPNGDPIQVFKGYTSGFGERNHPTLEKKLFHYGLDYRAEIGTGIIAPSDGVIEFAGFNTGGFGNLIIISHNYGFKTYYAHLSKIDVKVGDFVKKGQKIGNTGNTGRSSGPHLHYEVHYLGKKLNPKNFVSWNLENYESLFSNEKGVKWQFLAETINHQIQVFQQKE